MVPQGSGFLRFILSVLAVSTAFCGSVSPGPDGAPLLPARERCLVATSFVNEKLWLWQKRLNLADWKIDIVMSHPSDLKPKTLGNIHWDADKRMATIRVLDASDYKLQFPEMLQDMEFTVVHELIHLELSSLPRSEASRRDEEHAVNQIADALLKLDRSR